VSVSSLDDVPPLRHVPIRPLEIAPLQELVASNLSVCYFSRHVTPAGRTCCLNTQEL